ncbi:hypothetical protein SAMN05216503_1034 [Polaribacter sp. KT25b]|uniref:hypothetical protein n=1 Tax=Polaribacter sp. KT25b TaxID=1855336 RepID=UPI00087ABB7A|nr:hypothetical protein [Polaribacter sp. KT25b]SDR81855.1 hypothetical protein SAMN05216503_1034 [Polaribacter sp. KT25b]
MLGLILIYWLGKKFYKLAEEYNKSQWGYAILGIVVYYAVSIIFATVILIIIESFSNTLNDYILGLIAMPFGLLGCYLLYKYLEKTWEHKNPINDSLIDQIGKTEI